MPLFCPTLNKKFDQKWQRFADQGIPRIDLPIADTVQDLVLHDKGASKTSRSYIREPAIVLPLPPATPLLTWSLSEDYLRVAPVEDVGKIFMHYVALRMLRNLGWFFDRNRAGIPRVYASFSDASDDSTVVISCWAHFGSDVRMYLAPRIERTGATMSVSIAHLILWQQPWMNQHKDTHSWWIGLADGYANHFVQPGGVYHRAAMQIAQHRRYYNLPKYRYPEFFPQGPIAQYVQISEEYKSLYLFLVGDHQFPSGSKPGAVLHQLSNGMLVMCDKLMKQYGERIGQTADDEW